MIWAPRTKQLTFVAGGRVGPDDRLLHLWALVLRDQSTRDIEAADFVRILKSETEFLRVVVDVLDAVESQTHEALVYCLSVHRTTPRTSLPRTSALENLSGGRARDRALGFPSKLFGSIHRILLAAEGIVASTDGSYAESAVQERVVAATLRWLGGVSAYMLASKRLSAFEIRSVTRWQLGGRAGQSGCHSRWTAGSHVGRPET